MKPARFLVAVLCLLFQGGLALANGLTNDLAERRARLLEKLDSRTILVVWSAPAQVYSLDIDYEYRQNSNLLYLTGIRQPETLLVMMPGNKTRKEILFVSEPNALREHWNGHMLTKEEATGLSGIDTVFYASEFESFLAAMFSQQAFGFPRRTITDEYDAFFEAVTDGQARLAVDLGSTPRLSEPLPQAHDFVRRARERYLNLDIVDAGHLIAGLRQVKTPYEQSVLRTSLEISSRAHRAGMKTAAPGRYEYEVEAAIEQVYLTSGAMSPGYPSIVGSGPNGTILHYSESQRLMENGDLLLVDAAANYQDLTGDITRTYPVTGKFSPEQRELYQLVLRAQEAGMKAARVGNLTLDIERASEEVIKQGLLALGLITDAEGDQFRTWYTHGICHWIGMDVHDVGDYRRPLEPGMTFVIEPGLYIREPALDTLPDTPENREFIARVRPAVEKYNNLGIRIEDSFLLTASGLERLSSDVPREIEEIERFMAVR